MKIQIRLAAFESVAPSKGFASQRKATMEFHILRSVREEHSLEHALFSLTGNVVFIDFRQVRELTAKLNAKAERPERFVKAGQLNAMGLIDEILHYIVALYRERVQPDIFTAAIARIEERFGKDKTDALLKTFCQLFPPQQVYAGETTIDEYLNSDDHGESCRALALEELLLLSLANLNPAFKPFTFLFDDTELAKTTIYNDACAELRAYFTLLPPFGPEGQSLWDLLRAPMLASDTLEGQLQFIRTRWALFLGKFLARLLMSLDVIKEETKPSFFGPGPTQAYTYEGLSEYEHFSPDQDWMPRTVLLAKSTLVWLYQLSQKYDRQITTLDQIPDEELDTMARRGFTGLWLIGLWERSNASRTIKQWTGNPEAAASAYSLYDYDIAGELGGWDALTNLRERCAARGIHLGSDMVPNHTGIDSRWVIEHPDRFLQLSYPPFPTYNYNCDNLSGRDDVTVQIEEHYFSHSDAAVVFKRIDKRTGETRYIYHGNDGTSMPWNDTAQIDFLNPEAREAVIRTIIGVCQQFSIVRFDAAMTLAKRHIQRLWYPEPGRGGDIASRAEHAITNEEFNRRIPNEFWREVVDRCAVEAPNTLLLAEAFWMMEGYFVRTLGMHRVYNSAFMNMLKNEENQKYRATIKNTLEFDPEILKRFVNFMNNPDEETAVAQFGKGDKYFGICTLMVTMPGLPMFGHGQIEGFEEKYGMEYRRAYHDEHPDQGLIDRHEWDIFPLMKRRMIFSGSNEFCLYDFYTVEGYVNENVFAYSNRLGDDRGLVFYNNSYYATSGWVHRGAVAIPQKSGGFKQDTLSQALSLHYEGPYFTFLREHRSRLWFIRSSKEIAEKGIFVALKGYEAQIFVDIYEVEDASGRWAQLNAELAGRGVPDLYAAIQDFFLGEVYAPFMRICATDQMSALFMFCKQRVSSGIIEDDAEGRFSAALREPLIAFATTAAAYIGGAQGKYDPFNTRMEYPAMDAEYVYATFLTHLYGFLRFVGSKSAITSVPSANTADTTTLPLFESLRAAAVDTPRIAAFALGYALLSTLRAIIGNGASGAEAVALAEHWSLDRKLREAYAACGVSGDTAYWVTEIAKAVLARTAPEDTLLVSLSALAQSHGASLAETIVLANYEAEDFRRLLKVNRFNDITWFNKEAFDCVLFYAPLFLLMETPDAFAPAAHKPAGVAPETPVNTTVKARYNAKLITFEQRADMIEQIAEAFHACAAESGYRFDTLIELLSNAGKKAKN
ncbi:MAG: alpha-amylase [Treponema sp.]|jgi:glycosidase|nr:alpha-amylase [Treponema sp.]